MRNRPPCSIPECSKEAASRGLCGTHRKRQKLYGDPLRNAAGTQSVGRASTEDRFYAKVQHATTEVRPGLGACWLWTAAKNSDGYGSFFRNGRVALAHRASYEMHIGELPAEMYVLHRCDTPACVRPDHLFLGEQKDNVADMYEKGRESHQGPYADQCKYGHPWPEGSVAGTRRRCAICDREYTAKYEAARSERRRQSRRAPLPETVL